MNEAKHCELVQRDLIIKLSNQVSKMPFIRKQRDDLASDLHNIKIKLEQVIRWHDDAEKAIVALRHSKSWVIGRVITAPSRGIKAIIRRAMS